MFDNAKELRKSYAKENRSKQLDATLINDLHRYGTKIAHEFSRKMEQTEAILQSSKIAMNLPSQIPISSREQLSSSSRPNENIFNKFVKSITTPFINTKRMPFSKQKKNSVEVTYESNQKGYATNLDDIYSDLGQQLEMTKTFVSGFVSGGIAVAPIVAFQDIILKLSLSSQAIEKFYLDTSICSIECAVFSLILRLCVREDKKHDDLFKNFIVLVSAFISSSSQLSGDTIVSILFDGITIVVL